MTGPDDRRRGLTPFDGGVKKTETDPHPHAALVDKKEGGGDKNFRLAGAGEDPSPPVENLEGAVTTLDSGGPVRDASYDGRPGGSTPPASHSCVGCGYCCSKAPCSYSMRKYSVAHPCPGLYWDGERYRCDDVRSPMLCEEVAIGAGCCSQLNTWRGSKILRRPEIENPLPHHRRVESGDDL